MPPTQQPSPDRGARIRRSYSLFAPLWFVLLGSFGAKDDEHAAQLFAENCASCHGTDGDGQGTAEIDRPARSFKDGGFSYGNTPEALFRTISMGIPGTPMPGYDTSLSEDDRKALAAFVVTLGPEVRDVATEETILVVGGRPLVARGMLPAISEIGTSHPRGLLLGTTSGLTFEYRVDDVRLLGVRQGGFVERTDWTGRGGSALKPLGKLVYLVQGGSPEPSFFQEPSVALTARLERTWVRGNAVGLDYRLELEDGRRVGGVRETVSAYSGSAGSGFKRRFDFWNFEREETLTIDLLHAEPDAELVAFYSLDPLQRAAPRAWTILRREDGSVECVGFANIDRPAEPVDSLPDVPRSSGRVTLSLAPDEVVSLEVITIPVPDWSDEVRTQLSAVPFP